MDSKQTRMHYLSCLLLLATVTSYWSSRDAVADIKKNIGKVSGGPASQESPRFDAVHMVGGWAVRQQCTYPLHSVFFIYSSPHDWKRRAAIRDSLFGEQAKRFFNWTGVFVVEHSPEDSTSDFWAELEAVALGDVLLLKTGKQEASPDKLVLGMQWIRRHCSGALYVIKTDDDIMVQPFVLFQYLTDNVEPRGHLLHCTLKAKKAPGSGSITSQALDDVLDPLQEKSNSSGSREPMLPKSCVGRAIIMTVPVLHRIVRAYRILPSSHSLGTAYVTGRLAVAAGLGHVDLGKRVAWRNSEAYWFVDGWQIFFRLRGTFDATTLRRALWHQSFWYEALENDKLRRLLSHRTKAPLAPVVDEQLY